jgi:hypothetical protein
MTKKDSNIIMFHRIIAYIYLYWIQLAQDGIHWSADMNSTQILQSRDYLGQLSKN